jgi:hypothetical protein
MINEVGKMEFGSRRPYRGYWASTSHTASFRSEPHEGAFADD